MTKTIAMMQPYWFPYLGYFQLIAAADAFVLGDDLQYIKEGWVNRNRILAAGKPWLFSLPLKKGHFELAINQRQLGDNAPETLGRLLKTIALNYARAPYKAQVMPLLERLMLHPETNLARYIEHTLRELCAHLGINTPILRASNLPIGPVSDKQDRVVKTARVLDGDLYINPIGGMSLYEQAYFDEHQLGLRFHQMDALSYPQLKGPFVAHLSIIDVLMFNDVEQIRQWLPRFTLLRASEQPSAAKPAAPVHLASLQEMYS